MAMERRLMGERRSDVAGVAVIEQPSQALDKVLEDTNSDTFLSPVKAVEYGLIDRVVDSSRDGGIVTEG